MGIPKTSVNITVLTTDSSFRAIIPPSPNRISLIIGNTVAATIFVQFTQSLTAGLGLPILVNERLELLADRHGDAIRDGIRLLGTGAGQTISVVEFVEAP